MNDPECMVIVDDDDVGNGSKELESEDDRHRVIKCGFDINDFVAKTLAKLDVKVQIQDAITTCGLTLDRLENKAKLNDQIYRGLDERMLRLRGVVAVLDSPTPYAFKGAAVGSTQLGQQPRARPQGTQGENINGTRYQAHSTSSACVEVIPVGRVVSRPPSLPPNGPLIRKILKEGSRIYVMKGSAYKGWLRAKVVEIKSSSLNKLLYKVKFDNNKLQSLSFPGKQLAYFDPADVLLPVGTRVIAHYRDEYLTNAKELYAGIVAEPPKIMNRYRYLIFFEDGFAQYVVHSDIRVVCESSPSVWDDIHPDMQPFIRNYIKQYPERAMVKLEVGHSLKTEWNGEWWMTVAKEVDASLVKVFFHVDSRTEWIYRGSPRLEPLYVQMATAEARRSSGKISRRHSLAVTKRKSAPYVEFTRGVDETIGPSESMVETPEKRQVARKHTGGPIPVQPTPAKKGVGAVAAVQRAPPKVQREMEGTIEVRKHLSKVEPRPYSPHMCGPRCLNRIDDDPISHKPNNPLTVPMHCGWERQVVRHRNTCKLVVFYKGPCGRRMRNMEEVFRYLTETKSKLTVDLFTLDSEVYVSGEFVPTKEFCFIKDISYGKENVPVSALNSLASDYPEYVEYSTRRIPNAGVDLNLDPEFLIGCDCEDDCADPSKCNCRQLTIEATTILKGKIGGEPKSGYTYRRLNENIITGIYECNQRCKCSSRCLNRVVQNGLQLRLQVFKTAKRGWGMRCLDDIPKGCFICIYAGQLLNEERADKDGAEYGDEYLAELDYIEIVERQKDDYESDAREDLEHDIVGAKSGEATATDKTKEGSAEDDAHEDSDGSNFSTEERKRDSLDSSDSDFEAPTGEITHRVHATRNKIQKLILRRETSEPESDQSCLAVSSSSRSVQAGLEDGSADDKEGFTTAVAHVEEGEGHSAKSSDVPGKQGSDLEKEKNESEKRMGDHETEDSSEKAGSSDVGNENAKSIDTTASTQIEMMEIEPSTDKSTPSTAEIVSEEEDSIVSKISSTDQAKGKDEGSRFRNKSNFWSLPKPIEGDNSNKSVTADTKKVHQSVRMLFGEENCYIMDAKSLGNIGRYLNHSCSPNVFCQTVFVDTHDLRFGWVSFFTSRFVRAGTELTWDYSYEVDSVPNKKLDCECGASNCRGRLL